MRGVGMMNVRSAGGERTRVPDVSRKPRREAVAREVDAALSNNTRRQRIEWLCAAPPPGCVRRTSLVYVFELTASSDLGSRGFTADDRAVKLESTYDTNFCCQIIHATCQIYPKIPNYTCMQFLQVRNSAVMFTYAKYFLGSDLWQTKPFAARSSAAYRTCALPTQCGQLPHLGDWDTAY